MKNSHNLNKIKEQFMLLIKKYNLVAETQKEDNYSFYLFNSYINLIFEREKNEKDMFVIRIKTSLKPNISIPINKLYYYKNINLPLNFQKITSFKQHAFFLDKYYSSFFKGNFQEFEPLFKYSVKTTIYYGFSLNMPYDSLIHNYINENKIKWIPLVENKFYKQRYKDIESYIDSSLTHKVSSHNIALLKNYKKLFVDNLFEYICNEETLLEINKKEERITEKFDNNDLSWIDEVLDFINKKNNA